MPDLITTARVVRVLASEPVVAGPDDTRYVADPATAARLGAPFVPPLLYCRPDCPGCRRCDPASRPATCRDCDALALDGVVLCAAHLAADDPAVQTLVDIWTRFVAAGDHMRAALAADDAIAAARHQGAFAALSELHVAALARLSGPQKRAAWHATSAIESARAAAKGGA